MANVKPNGPIWGIEFNRYVCFSFRGNRTICGQDIVSKVSKVEVFYLSRLRLIVHKDKTSVCGKTSAYDMTSVHDQIHVGVNET